LAIARSTVARNSTSAVGRTQTLHISLMLFPQPFCCALMIFMALFVSGTR
jgi:hypothetical protein